MKIRASLLRDGTVDLAVEIPGAPTPKHRYYPVTEHYNIDAHAAEVLLYDLHSIVQTQRGLVKRPSLWRRLTRRS